MIHKHFKKGYFALIDQILVSGVNFLTIFFLARYMNPSEFGLFILVFSVLLFIKNSQYALITNPMMILGISSEKAETISYKTSLGVIQCLFNLGTIPLIFLAVAVISFLSPVSEIIDLCVAVSFATLTVNGQEFLRRMMFSQLDYKGAFWNDLISYGLQIIGIILLHRLNRLFVPNVFLIIGITSFLASIVGFLQCKKWFSLNTLNLKETLHKNLKFGKWLIGTTVMFWISNQSYIFITACYLPMKNVGALGACVGIFRFINILYFSLENFSIPLMSKAFNQGAFSKLKTFFRKANYIGTISMAVFCGLIAIFPRELLHLFYMNKYQGYDTILLLIAVQAFISFFSKIPIIGLKVLRKPEKIFYAYFRTAVFSSIASFLLIKLFGIYGVCISMILTQTILSGSLSYLYYQELYKKTYMVSYCISQ